jgi:hypothetical protein
MNFESFPTQEEQKLLGMTLILQLKETTKQEIIYTI